MKKLLIGIVSASAILFVALSSVSYADDVAGTLPSHRAVCAAANVASSADAPVVSSARDIKARFFAVLSSLLRSSSPIAGIVVPDRPVIDPNPPLKIPPDDTPPGIRLYDKIRLDYGWDEKK
jgi:hypothetical protein